MTTPATPGRAPSQPNLVPPSVRKQADEANKLVEGLKNRQKPEFVPASATIAKPTAPGVVEHAPPPAAAGPSAESVAAAAAQPVDSAEERARKAEQRYSSLRGKYDQEVGLTRDLNRQQAELIAQLMKDREERSPPPAAAAAPTNQTPEEILKSLGATDKDIEDYGELLPIVAKIAQNMFKPTLAKLESELTQLKAASGTVSKELVKSKQEAVFKSLDLAVPNWRFINSDDEFLDWLQHVDIFSGVTRRVALTSAFNALDAHRVAGIFQAYVQEDPARGAASGGPPVDAETLLAPGTPRGGPRSAPEGAGGKKIWSEKEIGDFYTRVRKKQVSSEEYNRTAQEIAVAVSEGRVRPTSPNRHINDQ